MTTPITRAEIEELRRLLPEDWADGVHIETLTDGSEDYCGTAARGPVRYRGTFDRDAEDDRVAALRDLRLLKAIPALLDAADERDRLAKECNALIEMRRQDLENSTRCIVEALSERDRLRALLAEANDWLAVQTTVTLPGNDALRELRALIEAELRRPGT